MVTAAESKEFELKIVCIPIKSEILGNQYLIRITRDDNVAKQGVLETHAYQVVCS